MVANARTIIILRDEPRKLLYIGFDMAGRLREAIVDQPQWEDGQPVCVHADTLTAAWLKYL